MYFDGCETLNDLKSEYRRLILMNHPDVGGSEETMKAINAEYDRVHTRLAADTNRRAESDPHVRKTTEKPEEFREILEKLLRIESITVELCGSWLWISGDTRPHRDELKAAGCRWSPKKKMWSWHHPEDVSHWYRGSRSMSEIRDKYGSTRFDSRGGQMARRDRRDA